MGLWAATPAGAPLKGLNQVDQHHDDESDACDSDDFQMFEHTASSTCNEDV